MRGEYRFGKCTGAFGPGLKSYARGAIPEKDTDPVEILEVYYDDQKKRNVFELHHEKENKETGKFERTFVEAVKQPK